MGKQTLGITFLLLYDRGVYLGYRALKSYTGLELMIRLVFFSVIHTWLTQLIGSFLPCDAMRCTVLVIVILSVRPSVRPSVCHTRALCPQPTIMISSPYGSHIILVSGDIKFIPKFEGGHPERGRWMRVGWVRIGDFRPISRRISETVRDTTKVTIDH